MHGPILEVKVSDGWATGVIVLPDDSLLTTAVDPFVRHWEPDGTLRRVFEGHEKSVAAMTVCPDGHHLLTGSVDGTARLWTIATGEPFCVLRGHTKTVAAAGFVRQGVPITGSYDRSVRLWDAEACTEIRALKGHPNNVVGVAVSPDGDLVASGGVGPEIRIWALPSGELLATLRAHELAAIPVAFTRDGSRLVTTGADDTIALWAVPDIVEVDRFSLGAKGTHTVRLAPDQRVAAVTLDNAVRLIDLRRGELVDEVRFDVKGVYGISFSADGLRLATATADSYVRLWTLGAEGDSAP